MSAIARAGGSLLPAIMVHVALDLHTFDRGYRALRKTGESGCGPAVSAAS